MRPSEIPNTPSTDNRFDAFSVLESNEATHLLNEIGKTLLYLEQKDQPVQSRLASLAVMGRGLEELATRCYASSAFLFAQIEQEKMIRDGKQVTHWLTEASRNGNERAHNLLDQQQIESERHLPEIECWIVELISYKHSGELEKSKEIVQSVLDYFYENHEEFTFTQMLKFFSVCPRDIIIDVMASRPNAVEQLKTAQAEVPPEVNFYFTEKLLEINELDEKTSLFLYRILKEKQSDRAESILKFMIIRCPWTHTLRMNLLTLVLEGGPIIEQIDPLIFEFIVDAQTTGQTLYIKQLANIVQDEERTKHCREAVGLIEITNQEEESPASSAAVAGSSSSAGGAIGSGSIVDEMVSS